jgi:hypothetical protein
MSNNRISCCCGQIECAYLFLQTKLLGLDPVFSTPGVKFWTRSFLGYTGISGTTCGPILKDVEGKPLYSIQGITLTDNIGISLDHQIWSDPKLITQIHGITINWGGSYNMQEKDFKYVITGNLLLPTQYRGITLIKTSDIENGKLFYKYFGGDLPKPLYTNIETCFNTKYDERSIYYRTISMNSNPGEVNYITDNGTICDLFGAETTYGITQVNVFAGITAVDQEAGTIIDNKHIFNIAVDYSDLYSSALKNDNHIFYSIIPGIVNQETESPIAPGTFIPQCDRQGSFLWCKGLTLPDAGFLTQGCYNIPAFKINNKIQSNAFYQSLPENIMVYKVDVYRCQDENGSSYLSLGDTKFVQQYTIQQITPRSDQDQPCPCSDLDETDPNWDGIPDKILIDDIKGPIHKMCNSQGIPQYRCNPQAGTGKGINWNENSCEKIFETLCDGCDPKGTICADKIKKYVVVTTYYEVTSIYNMANCEDFPEELRPSCNENATYTKDETPDGPITDVYNFDDYDPVAALRGRTSYRTVIYDNGPNCQFYYNYNLKINEQVITVDRCKGGSVDIQVPTYAKFGRFKYDCVRPCRTQFGLPIDCPKDFEYGPDQQYYRFIAYDPYTDPRDFDCCCGKLGNKYIAINQRKETTTYTINPYIMVDENPTYFDYINGVYLPNFKKYILNYLEQWKNDRRGLTNYETPQKGLIVDNYNVYCDNPKCSLGFVTKPYEYFFWDKTIGVTAGELTVKTNSSCNSTFVWKTLPNPDYPCRSTYSYDISKNLPILCYPNTIHKSSAYYEKIPESSTPDCWKKIKQQFPDGITISDCSAITSVDFVQSVIDQLYN